MTTIMNAMIVTAALVLMFGTMFIKKQKKLYAFASVTLFGGAVNAVAFTNQLMSCLQVSWLDKIMGKNPQPNAIAYLLGSFIIVSILWSLLTIASILRDNNK
jgi:hypothetical protein